MLVSSCQIGHPARGSPFWTPGLDRKTGSLGNDLLSRPVTGEVPSALEGLTAGFGMGPGVSPPL